MVSEETPARPPEVLQRAGSHAPDVTRALRRIARRRVLADGVWKTVGTLAAPLAAAALLAGRFQEGTVFWTLTAAILASLGALAFSLRNALRRNSLRSLCKLYQLDCPEDECALDAVLELEAASTQPTDFQREYLALLQKRYLSKDSPLDKSPRLRPRLRLPLLALSLLALFALGRAGGKLARLGMHPPGQARNPNPPRRHAPACPPGLAGGGKAPSTRQCIPCLPRKREGKRRHATPRENDPGSRWVLEAHNL